MEEEKSDTKSDITCKPIDTFEDVLGYMENPPSWVARCIKYCPTGTHRLRNWDFHIGVGSEHPRYYCHYNPDYEGKLNIYDDSLLPKTLICHDMANGYHDDSYVDGTSNSEAYHFYDWAAVDMFCYFSHHFITIPPLSWINAAHLHDVKVMGTIITEWKDGEALCGKILASVEAYERFADSLVAITRHHRMEGWLLNVENKIERPPMLLGFVRYLHSRLQREVPGAVLLWYDSVTVEGKLAWQNGLNELNLDFFHACDGIFTNYSWRENHVRSSAKLAARHNRRLDVFVGIDVWGRNFYGGGLFNSAAAVKVAFEHGCSLAVFAPAWTHEAAPEGPGGGGGGGGGVYAQFLLREKALWDTLWPYLNTRLPSRLPFRTSFCRGRGTLKMRNGELEKNAQWHNMVYMEYQPNSHHGPHGYRLVNDNYKDDKTEKSEDKASSAEEAIVPVLPNTISSESKDEINIESNDEKTTHAGKTTTAKKRTRDSPIRKQKILDEQEKIGCANSSDKVIAKKSKEFDDVKELTNIKPDTTVAEKCKEKTEKVSTADDVTPHPVKASDIVRYRLEIVPDDKSCVEYFSGDAFNGGSCLLVQPTDRARTVRLFHCLFPCVNKLIVCVVTKNVEGFEEQSLNVICKVTAEESKEVTTVVLTGETAGPSTSEREERLDALESSRLNDVRKYLLTNSPGTYVPIENTNNWKVRYFLLEKPGTRLTSISCRADKPTGAILLGHIALLPL